MKSSKAKTVIGTVAVMLILLLLVGGLAALSSGFKDWDVKNWINPEYVTTLENYSFNGDDSSGYLITGYNNAATDKYIMLPSITNFDKTVVGIYNGFANISSLVGVRIPDGYKEVGSMAFQNCFSLRKVYIPASVEKMADLVFYGCHDLTIYCEVSEQPADWNSNWNQGAGNLKVVWGYRA